MKLIKCSDGQEKLHHSKSEPQMTLSIPLRAQFDALPEDWRGLLHAYLDSAACKELCRYIDQAQTIGKCIYPEQVFHALHITPVASVKVIILGQDPYHGVERLNGKAQAHGLAFSVPDQVRCPPSLRNIFRELHQDLAIPKPTHGCLTSWAAQGVLLLNTSLTVEAQRPASHARLLNGNGWEKFTTTLLEGLAAYHSRDQDLCTTVTSGQKTRRTERSNETVHDSTARREYRATQYFGRAVGCTQVSRRLVVLLWGNHAQTKAPLFAAHDVLQAAHPSPLSEHRGFFGCRHFSRTNQLLSAAGQAPIDWRLPEIGVSEQ